MLSFTNIHENQRFKRNKTRTRDRRMASNTQEFREITKASAEEAVFYLQQANGDLETAILRYFEDQGEGDEEEQPVQPVQHGQREPPRASILPIAHTQPQPVASNPSPTVPAKKKPTNSSGPRIGTFSDLRKPSEADRGDGSKPLNFYTGGTSSGISVEGGGAKKPPSAAEVRDDAFSGMQNRAAEEGDDEYEDLTQKKKTWFTGQGQSLGNTSASGQKVAGAAAPPTVVKKIIYFWANGFSVNDGPLRGLDDPANVAFLRDIQQGFIPKELTSEAVNEKIAVDIEDRRTEQYVPPAKPKAPAFVGSGQKLSSTTPQAVAVPVVTQGGSAKIVVNESQPTTSVQIRMHDGSKVVVKLNHTHTVGDLYKHIDASTTPGKKFVLSNTYPRKALADMAQTVAEAGILGASLQHSFA